MCRCVHSLTDRSPHLDRSSRESEGGGARASVWERGGELSFDCFLLLDKGRKDMLADPLAWIDVAFFSVGEEGKATGGLLS
mmetsp:Transcript_9823/g.31977  ORF Transcript_9823/g.31977 Transcript_9823/m.31977 type:complete len:81 (-) Transcript_9823:191-433(-)